MPNKRYKILGVSGGVNDLWLLTDYGWIKSSKILYYGLFNKNTFAYKNYQNLIQLIVKPMLHYFLIYQ